MLALLGRQSVQVPIGTGDSSPTVIWQAAELLHGAANLLALRGLQTLHLFGALDGALALTVWHAVELGEPILDALLLLRLELTVARFGCERVLLLRKRLVAMAFHPLRQMLIAKIIVTSGGRRAGLRRATLGTLLSECGGEAEHAERQNTDDSWRPCSDGAGWGRLGHDRWLD